MNNSKKYIIKNIVDTILINTENNKLNVNEKDINTYNIAVNLKNIIIGNNVLESIKFFKELETNPKQLSIDLYFRTVLEIIFSNNSRTLFCDELFYAYNITPCYDLDIADISEEQMCDILDEWIFDKKPVVFRKSRIFDIIFR